MLYLNASYCKGCGEVHPLCAPGMILHTSNEYVQRQNLHVQRHKLHRNLATELEHKDTFHTDMMYNCDVPAAEPFVCGHVLGMRMLVRMK
jgi:hypothetical protein